MEKAPDKIYCGNNGHGNLSYSTEKIYPSMEEYIRKDAILEWAKERLEFAKALRSDGQMVICEELIKHINSL